MVKILYDISIYLLNVLVSLASAVEPKAGKLYRGRKDWYQKLIKAIQKNGEGMIWFHCASLGEFEQGRPVIEKIKQLYPQTRIILTFYSPSGYEVRKDYKPADVILYLPSDTPSNAKKFIETVKPKIAIFIKYEFWYNFIRNCKLNNIPLISISSIFRPEQIFFKPWGKLFRKMLLDFSAFFVQDEISKLLLEKIGITEIYVSGDTRFDRVHDICSSPKDIELASRFSENSNVMVIGSAWPSDMKVLAGLINNTEINLKFMVAPHNIGEGYLREIERLLAVKSIRYSEGNLSDDPRVLIIDNVGMLYSLYRYGKIAYVGGAFKGGLHNILEPAAYGIPVIFGKHSSNRKFRETSALITAGGGFSIANEKELISIIKKLISEKVFYNQAANASRDYIKNNTGATDMIVTYILHFLNE